MPNILLGLARRVHGAQAGGGVGAAGEYAPQRREGTGTDAAFLGGGVRGGRAADWVRLLGADAAEHLADDVPELHAAALRGAVPGGAVREAAHATARGEAVPVAAPRVPQQRLRGRQPVHGAGELLRVLLFVLPGEYIGRAGVWGECAGVWGECEGPTD